MTTSPTRDNIFALARSYGLSASETEKLIIAQQQARGQLPTPTEVAVTGALWSEHCSYKSSKFYIKQLHFNEPWVITAAGENAGAIDIGDNQAIIFKMESHNHPSYLEPFHGAATGVGGILRDIFTMGAKPIANVNALRFGDVDDAVLAKKMRGLVRGVVKGISHYGNCVGVPMVTGETEFLPCYNGNILVNAMTVGLVEQGKMASAMAKGIGNWVIYLGSKTGRDGVKGAVMASQEFSGSDEEQKPAVQVGDPFAEKLLLDLCLQLIADKKFIAIQDMGAAGLSSSSAEMADKGGVGIEIELSQVPMREANMRPEELMLSESQERMLAIIEPKNFDVIKKLFSQSHLDCEKIGEVIAEPQLIIKMNGKVEAHLATNLLVGQAPLYTAAERPLAPLPTYNLLPDNMKGGFFARHETRAKQENTNPAGMTTITNLPHLDIKNYLEKYFASSFGADKSFIYEQYDRLVQGNSIFTSGQASAGVIKIPHGKKALAVSCHGDPLLCHANPAIGGRAIILGSYRKLCAVGARPLAYTNNLNFGNPENPTIMAAFATILRAMGDVSRELHFPTISGNVSLYNQTAGKDIYHTPVIGGVGVIEDYKKSAGYILPREPQILWLLGDGEKVDLAASRYGFLQLGENNYSPPAGIFDIAMEEKLGSFVQNLIIEEKVKACKAVGAAGLLVDAITMALPNMLGLRVVETPSWPRYFCGIGGARYLVAGGTDIEKQAKAAGIAITKFADILSEENPQLKIGEQMIMSLSAIKNIRQQLKNKII